MKIRICEYLKMWIHHKRNDTISEKLIGIIRTTMKIDDSAKKTDSCLSYMAKKTSTDYIYYSSKSNNLRENYRKIPNGNFIPALVTSYGIVDGCFVITNCCGTPTLPKNQKFHK
jgi:hypothetical protein